MVRRKLGMMVLLLSLLLFLSPLLPLEPLNLARVNPTDRYSTTRQQAVIQFIAALQMSDGLFNDRLHSYFSERSLPPTHYALVALSMLEGLAHVDLDAPVEFCTRCQREDGGFNLTPGSSESELSVTYLAIRLLNETNGLGLINVPSAVSWLQSLQRPDGGFNDFASSSYPNYFLCNTAWVLEALLRLGAVSVPNRTRVIDYILSCQGSDGGFSELPYSYSSIDGTFFAIRSLYLLGELDRISSEDVSSFVLQNYDTGLQTFSPQSLAGFLRPYLTLSLLNRLELVNVTKAVEVILSLQSPLHGGFVTKADDLYRFNQESVRVSHDFIELLFALGEGDQLGGTIDVQEVPVWVELTMTPRLLSFEAAVIVIVVLISTVISVFVYVVYSSRSPSEE